MKNIFAVLGHRAASPIHDQPSASTQPTEGLDLVREPLGLTLDDEIVAAFKAESARTGTGYQTLINDALAQHIGTAVKPMTADQVRKIVREELATATR
jgi:uncharacterized protein (DUF4415 family)